MHGYFAMASPDLFIIDFSRDPAVRDWGAAVASALPEGMQAAVLRGTAGASWAAAASRQGCPVILSGSDVPVPRDEPWFALQCAETRAAVDAGVPLFGICFGQQLIAQALGGVDAVRRAACGEFGVTEITPLAPLADDPVLGRALPAQGFAAVYNLHADEVDAAAARRLGFAVLASSPDCAVQALRLPGRKVWGVQFHPELTGGIVAGIAASAAAEFGNAATDPADLAAIAEGPSRRRPEILAAFLAIARS